MGQDRQLAIEVSQGEHRLAAEGSVGGRQESKVQDKQRRGEYWSTGSKNASYREIPTSRKFHG